MLLGKSGGQFFIASGGMKQLGQRRNDAQLGMCLEVKVKFDAGKIRVSVWQNQYNIVK